MASLGVKQSMPCLHHSGKEIRLNPGSIKVNKQKKQLLIRHHLITNTIIHQSSPVFVFERTIYFQENIDTIHLMVPACSCSTAWKVQPSHLETTHSQKRRKKYTMRPHSKPRARTQGVLVQVSHLAADCLPNYLFLSYAEWVKAFDLSI